MAQAECRNLEIPFWLRGASGTFHVSIAPNVDPLAVGCEFLLFGMPSEVALSYPVCTATVEYEREGYAAIFGWTQLVRSTDNSTGGESFEVDPIAVYRDVDTPYAWYGFRPTLFDAPFRFDKRDMSWECHSFLCFLPDAVLSRNVRAITGFSWGFDIRAETISIYDPVRLDAEAWNHHVSVLRDAHPNWTFGVDFHESA
jgi:hypothetical protein